MTGSLALLPLSRNAPGRFSTNAARGALLAASVAAVVLLEAAARGEDAPPPQQGAPITDPALGEISGIVPASGRDGVFWVHNDSGDRPRIFALEDSGKILGAVDVDGASAVDWEDIAAGPGPCPGRHLFLADTGNNDGARAVLTVYRFLEPPLPAPPAGERAGDRPKCVSERAAALPFRYPGRPLDCEAIAVHPRKGTIYLISKELHQARVFSLESLKDPGREPQTARQVLTIPRVSFVTAADISADGRCLLLATYFSLTERRRAADAPFEDLFSAPPVLLTAPLVPVQREAACYATGGKSCLVVCEAREARLERIERPVEPPAARPRIR